MTTRVLFGPDTFESGGFGSWSTTGANIVVSTNEAITGTYSARNNHATDTSGGQGYMQQGDASVTSVGGRGRSVYMKCSYKPQNAPSARLAIIVTGVSRGCGRNTDGKLFAGHNVPTLGTAQSTAPTVDQVYTLEVYVDWAGNGQEIRVRVYLDGTLVAEDVDTAGFTAGPWHEQILCGVTGTKVTWGEIWDDITVMDIPTWN